MYVEAVGYALFSFACFNLSASGHMISKRSLHQRPSLGCDLEGFGLLGLRDVQGLG